METNLENYETRLPHRGCLKTIQNHRTFPLNDAAIIALDIHIQAASTITFLAYISSKRL